MTFDVRNNEEKSQFETTVDGHVALTAYDLEDPDRIVFTHTDVPEALAGRGYRRRDREVRPRPRAREEAHRRPAMSLCRVVHQAASGVSGPAGDALATWQLKCLARGQV